MKAIARVATGTIAFIALLVTGANWAVPLMGAKRESIKEKNMKKHTPWMLVNDRFRHTNNVKLSIIYWHR